MTDHELKTCIDDDNGLSYNCTSSILSSDPYLASAQTVTATIVDSVPCDDHTCYEIRTFDEADEDTITKLDTDSAECEPCALCDHNVVTDAPLHVARRPRGRPFVNADMILPPKRQYKRKCASPRDNDTNYRQRREANNLAVRRTRAKHKQLVATWQKQVVALTQLVHALEDHQHKQDKRIDRMQTMIAQLKAARC